MVDLMGYSVLVDNEEQARKLQEMAISQGLQWKYGGKVLKNLNERYFLFGYGGEKVIICSSSHYKDKHITNKAHFNELFDSLEQCNMKLTKENVYINLQDKTKEELTELYWLLRNNNEPLTRGRLNCFIEYPLEYKYLSLDEESWNGYYGLNKLNEKTEVTIEQLKEILQPIDTLEQQLEKAKAGVERLEKEIKEQNNPKVGDWCKFWDDGNEKDFVISKLCNYYFGMYHDYYTGYDNAEKITNTQLIQLLENERNSKSN